MNLLKNRMKLLKKTSYEVFSKPFDHTVVISKIIEIFG